MNTKIYDTIIVGAGVSGIFAAYSLLCTKPKEKVLLLEMGNTFEKRICPIENGNTSVCLKCDVCNRFFGFGGLGKSEGKFNFTNDFGGNLINKIGVSETNDLMHKLDKILSKFGGSGAPCYSTYNSDFQQECIKNGVDAIFSNVRHLGHSRSNTILQNMFEWFNSRLDMCFNTEVLEINKNDIFSLTTKDKVFFARKVVIATGGNNQNTTQKYLEHFDINMYKTRVDLGIRIETSINIFDRLLTTSPEFKILCKCCEGKNYAYTYCMNPYGYVIKKYQNGLVLADGQNYHEKGKKSSNINFVIFVPNYFETQQQSELFIREIVKNINKNSEQIIVQRLCDFKRNTTTAPIQIHNGSVVPTLNAVAGNLIEFLPYSLVNGTLTVLDAIEKLVKKKLCDDTLLYGLDLKTYSPVVETDSNFQTNVSGLYFIGDCSGETWSLSQAAVSGLYLGEKL